MRRYCRLAALLVLLGPAGGASADFTFAHVTDIHITGDLSRYAELGLRTADWVKAGAARTWDVNRKAITDAVNRTNPDFVIVTGDLSEAGANIEFANVAAWAQTVRAPVYLIPGNHDSVYPAKPAGVEPWNPESGNRSLLNYERVFGRGFYAFGHQNAYFINMTSFTGDKEVKGDAYQLRRHREQQEWLERELRYANSAGYPFVFVFRHHPYGTQPWLDKALSEAGVSAFIFGHIHRYTAPVHNGVQWISGTSVKGPRDNPANAPSFGLVRVGAEQATYQLLDTDSKPLAAPVTMQARKTSPDGLWATRARLFPNPPPATCETLLSAAVPD